MNGSILPLLPYIVPLLLLVIVVRRSLRERRVKLQTLWIVPAVFAAVTVYVLAHSPPPSPLALAELVGGFAVGCGVGWLRGKTTRLKIDGATGELVSRATPLAMILFAAIFVARTSLRMALLQDPTAAAGVHPELPRYTDILLVFALGMVAAQRLEIWLRGRQFLPKPRPAPKPKP